MGLVEVHVPLDEAHDVSGLLTQMCLSFDELEVLVWLSHWLEACDALVADVQLWA